MSSFSFVLTEECNWNCECCYFSKLPIQKKPQIEVYRKHLLYIHNIISKINELGLLVNIDIQGGEVGLIDKEILQYFFETIGYTINVGTNGEFLKREYHLDNKIRPHIGFIMWHVTNDFNVKLDDYIDDKIWISKGIVHNNIDEMISFIKLNNHILFDYVEFEFDIDTPHTANLLMYKDLITKLEKLKNVTDNAKQILKRKFHEKENLRENCSKYNGSILIDIVNETICLCQRQPNISIPLTEKNLIYRLKNFPKDVFKKENNCNTCTRLYSGKFYGNVIERALTLRRKL
jgi:hypothetical protein